MAFTNTITWEVRTAGNDNSGGGFDRASAGTDRSQQDAAFASGTNLTVDAVTNTDVAPDGYAPVAGDVGNMIQITAGAGFTLSFYLISSIVAGKWRLDRSPAAVGTAGGTWAMGGALASPGKLGAAMEAGGAPGGQWAYIKSGTYSVSVNSDNVSNGKFYPNVTGGQDNQTRVIGYQTTRGDGGTKPILRATITIAVIFSVPYGARIENLEFDGNAQAGTRGCDLSSKGFVFGQYMIYKCKATNCTNGGIYTTLTNGRGEVWFCEVSGCTGTTSAFTLGSGCFAYGCVAHDNSVKGFTLNASARASRCIADSNSGATSDGFYGNNWGTFTLYHCVAYNNGRHGFEMSNTALAAGQAGVNTLAVACIAENNAGYGYNTDSAAVPHEATGLISCSGYNNTSGNYPAGGSSINVGFVAQTASAFNNPAGGDFSLNGSVGGGSLLRDLAPLGAFPIGSTGYLDIGAVESSSGGTDTGGGGGNPTISGEQLWMLTSGRKVERWQASATTDDGTALPAWVYKTGVLQVNDKSYVRRILSQVETATVTATVLNSPATGETGQAKTLATVEDEKRYPPHYKGYTWCIKLSGANTAAVTRLHVELAPVEGEGSERTT